MRNRHVFTDQLMRSDTKKRVRMYFYDHSTVAHSDAETQGELLVYNVGDESSDGRIAENGITFYDNFNKDTDYTLGTVSCNYVTVSLLNDDGGLDNFNWNRYCRIYIDALDPDASPAEIERGEAWYDVDMGIYIFDRPQKVKTKIVEATGYDLASTLDVIADDWWNNLDFSGGLTAANIFTYSGLNQFDGAQFGFSAAYTYRYTERPFDAVQLTYRDIFGKLAESMACKVYVQDGLVMFMPFKTALDQNNNQYTYDFSTLGSGLLNIDVSEYEVASVDKVKIANSQYDFGMIVGDGENAYIITDNPFLYSLPEANLEARANAILIYLEEICGEGLDEQYTPMSIECIGSPSTIAGDVIIVIYNGTQYYFPIFQQTITFRGGLIKVKMWSSGNPKREPLTAQNRSEFRGQKQVHEVIINQNTLLSRINDFNGSGSTIEQTINGINTTVSGKVGYDEVISSINQTPEQITIDASKISLLGYVTVNNGFSIDENGRMSATGATINGSIRSVSPDNANDWAVISGGYFALHTGNYNNVVITRDNTDAGHIQIYRSADGTLASHLYPNDFAMYDPTGQFRVASLESLENLNQSAVILWSNTDGTERVRLAQGQNASWLQLRDPDGTIRDTLFRGSYRACDTSGALKTYVGYDGAGFGTDADVDEFNVGWNATFYGSVDIVNRRCTETLASVGWYRAVRLKGLGGSSLGYDGSIVDLAITRHGSTNDVHKVSLFIVRGSYKFDVEESVSTALGVDQIRFTDNGTDAFIDIHYNLSTGNSVSVAWDVKAVWYDQDNIVAESLQAVLNAPAGETVRASYTFGSNVNKLSELTIIGDLTANGVLDATQRRSYATLSSAGWYRIIRYNADANNEALGLNGRIFNISVARRFGQTNNEVHKITLLNPYNSFRFVDESSASNVNLITQIRVTHNSTTHVMYIDVYYSASNANNVLAAFDMFSAIDGVQAKAISIPFNAVAAAPSGETIIATYDFSANVSQGRDIDMITNLGTQLSTGIDLNNITTPGKYYLSSGADTIANLPYTGSASGYFDLVVAPRSRIDRVWQILMDGMNGAIYKRRMIGATTWSAWTQL